MIAAPPRNLTLFGTAFAPLAELATGERFVERGIEVVYSKRLAEELQLMLRGEFYRVVVPETMTTGNRSSLA
jgi:hypothetical protein